MNEVHRQHLIVTYGFCGADRVNYTYSFALSTDTTGADVFCTEIIDAAKEHARATDPANYVHAKGICILNMFNIQ